MSHTLPGAVLHRAEGLLSRHHSWTQNARHRGFGEDEQVCLDEALVRANRQVGGNGRTLYEARCLVVQEIYKLEGRPSIGYRLAHWMSPQSKLWSWNDAPDRTRIHVLKVLDAAAKAT